MRKRKPWRRRSVWIGAAAILLGAVAWFAVHVRDDRRMPHIDPGDAQQVALGRRLYGLYCASCHGPELEGQADWRSRKPDGRLPAPPHDETGHTWHHEDAALFRITKLGTEHVVGGNYRSDMVGFGEHVSDVEIIAILAYIKSRWSPEIQRRQAAIDARARAEGRSQ